MEPSDGMRSKYESNGSLKCLVLPVLESGYPVLAGWGGWLVCSSCIGNECTVGRFAELGLVVCTDVTSQTILVVSLSTYRIQEAAAIERVRTARFERVTLFSADVY